MARILGIGVATLDIINYVDQYPAADDEVRAQDQRMARGGNATNTLTVLSQFGHVCSWGGVLAQDPYSDYIRHALRQSGIDYEYSRVQARGSTPVSCITISQAAGSRSIIHYRDLPEFGVEDFRLIPLAAYDWVHFEGRNVADTRRMLEYARQQENIGRISVEIEKPRDNIESLIPLADIVFYSKNYVWSQGYENAEKFLHAQYLRYAHLEQYCAWGELGAWAVDIQGECFHAEASMPEKLVDTLGAGDTFNAALIHAKLKGLDMQQVLGYACELAGRKCGQSGFDGLAASSR